MKKGTYWGYIVGNEILSDVPSHHFYKSRDEAERQAKYVAILRTKQGHTNTKTTLIKIELEEVEVYNPVISIEVSSSKDD